jgi:Outer membrane protein beta-barrel domain
MKKGILVCALVLVLSVLVAVPASAAIKSNFGLRAGASMSNVKWSDDAGDEKSIVKPTFGAFALVKVTPMLAIQPEINYLVTGEKWDITDGTNVENFTYLQVPILLRVQFMKEGKFVPFALAGPAVGFLLSAKDGGEDVKDFFKSTDFGAVIGLGGEFGLGKMKGLVDLRYYMGLTNAYNITIVAEGLLAAPMDYTMKNAAFSLTFGVIF